MDCATASSTLPDPPPGINPERWAKVLKPYRANPTAWPIEQIVRCVELYNAGLGYKLIGDAIGRSKSSVSKKLWNLGFLKTRRLHEQRRKKDTMPTWVKYVDFSREDVERWK